MLNFISVQAFLRKALKTICGCLVFHKHKIKERRKKKEVGCFQVLMNELCANV